MIFNGFKFAIAAVAIMMASTSVTGQTTLMVTNLDDAGEGSLREAIDLANLTAAEDTILFTESGTIELESQLPSITTPLTIDGGGEVTLDAGNGEDDLFATGDGFRIFNVDDGQGDSVDAVDSITLIGLTLTGGDTPINGGIFQSPGGAIRNREVLNLVNVQIVDNAAGGGGTDFPDGIDGGGIFNLAGVLTLTDCTVSGNRAGDGANASGSGQDARGGEGGGIFSSTSGRASFPPVLTLIRTTVSGNSSGRGGTNDGDPAPGGRGGGIYSVSTTVLENCTISGNSTDSGTDEDPTFDADGSAISFLTFGGRSLTISNCTITDNLVAGADSSGAIYSNGSVVVENSIVAGNFADVSNIDFQLVNSGILVLDYSLVGQTSDPSLVGDDNIFGASPSVGPLADNGGLTETHALLAGSAAIDAGDPSFGFNAGDVDQRGNARVADGGVNGLRVDIGAFELSPNAFLLGDANLDGTVNFLDISAFISILSASGDLAQADVNMDGMVNFLDIAPFIGLLANSGG